MKENIIIERKREINMKKKCPHGQVSRWVIITCSILAIRLCVAWASTSISQKYSTPERRKPQRFTLLLADTISPMMCPADEPPVERLPVIQRPQAEDKKTRSGRRQRVENKNSRMHIQYIIAPRSRPNWMCPHGLPVSTSLRGDYHFSREKAWHVDKPAHETDRNYPNPNPI